MINSAIQKLRANIASVFLGHPRAVDQLLIGLFARGHVLIEDVPGVGKTVLAKSLARSISCNFSRIQLTPDLMPGDVLGVSVFNAKAGEFEFKPGPVFAHVILADEINRTTPRTQSALLEAMAEEQVSIENRTYPLERPFMVVATQNPFEFEGTYYLPENQLDRFLLRINIGYPPREAERQILTTEPGRGALDRLEPVLTAQQVVEIQDHIKEIKMDASIVDYLLDLIEATRHHEQLHLGLSPRGALALTASAKSSAVVHGRTYVEPDDIKQLFLPVCAHRIISKSYLNNGDNQSAGRVLQSILDTVPTPR